MPDSRVSEKFHPCSAQPIPNTPNIYDMYQSTEAKQLIQESSCTDILRENRSLHPRVFVNKISKWFLLKSIINFFIKQTKHYMLRVEKCLFLFIYFIYIYIYTYKFMLSLYFLCFFRTTKD